MVLFQILDDLNRMCQYSLRFPVSAEGPNIIVVDQTAGYEVSGDGCFQKQKGPPSRSKPRQSEQKAFADRALAAAEYADAVNASMDKAAKFAAPTETTF